MSMPDSDSDNNQREAKKIRPVVLNVSKKILSRESIFRNITHPPIDLDLQKSTSKLTDEQIKSSHLYNKLIERIQALEK